MALVSPGIQISVTDQSQYVPNQVGSVPLVLLATAQNKTYNGALASGTTKANAGKLLSFTSQRDLVTAMGTPSFQISSAGTPVNASEVNEYGLMAAYSALGLGNQLFAIRADIDLAQLTGTPNRPVGAPADGAYWLNLATTEFGIYSLNQSTKAFDHINPLLITDVTQLDNDPFGYYGGAPVAYPKTSVGSVGSYALVFVNDSASTGVYGNPGASTSSIRLFYKAGRSGSGTNTTTAPGTTANNTTGTSTNSAYTLNNRWVEVGSPDWQRSIPVVTSKVIDGNITIPGTVTSGTVLFTINGTQIVLNSSNFSDYVSTNNYPLTAAKLATAINSANGSSFIPGVFAQAVSGQLYIYATSSADSTGTYSGTNHPDGKVLFANFAAGTNFTGGTGGTSGIPTTAVACPYFFYGDYASAPTDATGAYQGWGLATTDTAVRPSGSIWWKTSALGGGWNPSLEKYSASSGKWQSVSAPMYTYLANAIYGLDPNGGGVSIQGGQVVAQHAAVDSTWNSLRFSLKLATTSASAIGGVIDYNTNGYASNLANDTNQYFTIRATQPKDNRGLINYGIISTAGSAPACTPSTIVNQILALNIPYVTASLSTNGPTTGTIPSTETQTITLTHTLGGVIVLTPCNSSGVPLGTPNNLLSDLGFRVNSNPALNGVGYEVNPVNGQVSITNWTSLTPTVQYSSNSPYTAPADGTFWYYSNFADVDVMINDGGVWKGYQNVQTDIRNYSLGQTDPNGVIVTATAPLTQTDGTSLVAGDLWLNSSDLVNYPNLSRWNGTSWVQIDNTDHVTSNGIVFADARWDSNGQSDIINATFPTITSLLKSNYVDQDVVDPRLYPKGTLLFNTRRGGFNVKKYVKNYFNSTSFPNPGQIPGTANTLPLIADAWVSDSGTDNKGRMLAGSKAQRAIVVAAMKSAVDSNFDVREDSYQFSIICAPGYPELIPNMISLNDDRSDTAFVIGDTPMTMGTSVSDITKWETDADGSGLATASPYLAVYYPAGLTNDLAGNTVVVPASHAVLRTFLYNDNVSYPWFAPAGVHRGLVSNLSDIGYVDAVSGNFVHNAVNQGLRDALYSLNINPITQLPGTGLVIWGQETRSGDSTARNRVNVVRLENYLRTIFKRISNGYLFEPNDTITRKSIANQIESALHDLLSKRGLYDFLVICDTSNNTSSTIANNQLYVDVAIEPMKDVEFIYIPIALYNPGAIATLGQQST